METVVSIYSVQKKQTGYRNSYDKTYNASPPLPPHKIQKTILKHYNSAGYNDSFHKIGY
ncbi:predicted protein [Botrytis cinerea T4]|uniref:Uncharacterized protein n=1 Tax=Botryotinia fuckeliana (strain T4) TaxID=999810 RepID=G2XWB1_BOTF4|nr:predicted protein [Botrytis cinerea T4]